MYKTSIKMEEKLVLEVDSTRKKLISISHKNIVSQGKVRNFYKGIENIRNKKELVTKFSNRVMVIK